MEELWKNWKANTPIANPRGSHCTVAAVQGPMALTTYVTVNKQFGVGVTVTATC